MAPDRCHVHYRWMQALTPARTSFASVGQINTPVMKVLHPTVAENYTAEWTEVYEEVSTSGKSCQNETDNHVGGGLEALAREQDEPVHQFQPIFGGESQQQYQYDDVDLGLHCNELFRMSDMDFSCDFGTLDEPYISNPNEDYPTLDILDTPPLLNTVSIGSLVPNQCEKRLMASTQLCSPSIVSLP